MSWMSVAIGGSALIGGGASLIGASNSADAAKEAAGVQARAADRSSATMLEMYNRTRSDLSPYMGTGVGALNKMAKLYGMPTYTPGTAGSPTLPGMTQGGVPQGMEAGAAAQAARGVTGGVMAGGAPGGVPGAGGVPGSGAGGWQETPGTGKPDYSDFTSSPDYDFAFDEGERAVNRSLSAKGGLVSGNALRAATRFGQGMATQQYGSYFNRLNQIAGMGQSAAAGVGNAGITTGQAIGNNITGAGQANASGIVGGANAWNAGLGGVASAASGGVNSMLMMQYLNRGRTNPGSSSYGNNPGDFNPNLAGGFQGWGT